MLKARADSLTNLKVIVLTMFITTLFNLAFSVTVIIIYTDCYAIHKREGLNSIFKLIDRLDAYIIWQYPLIYLFWPT